MATQFKKDVVQNLKVHRDTRRSVVALKVIKDVIKDILEFDRITFLEQELSPSAITLDRIAGIDCLIQKNGVLKGMATRVQWCTDAYNTFTIRYKRDTGNKTEYAKRTDQINTEGSIYPFWMLQAYFSRTGNFMSVGIIETKKLYKYIEDNMDKIEVRNTENASFIVVRWDNLSPDVYYVSGDKWS